MCEFFAISKQSTWISSNPPESIYSPPTVLSRCHRRENFEKWDALYIIGRVVFFLAISPRIQSLEVQGVLDDSLAASVGANQAKYLHWYAHSPRPRSFPNQIWRCGSICKSKWQKQRPGILLVSFSGNSAHPSKIWQGPIELWREKTMYMHCADCHSVLPFLGQEGGMLPPHGNLPVEPSQHVASPKK